MVTLLNFLSSFCFYGSGRFLGNRIALGYTSLSGRRRFSLVIAEGKGSQTWNSLASSIQSHQMSEGENDISLDSSDNHNRFKNWLVVGDGDLSYSKMISEQLAGTSETRLVATVLEEEEVHNQVYERSKDNSKTILSHAPHEVKFGVDATNLLSFFPHTKFDTIEFNFPHWRGKTNAKRNRELLDTFLKSASSVLKPSGEIRIALCHGQGGMPADSLQDWRKSWLPATYAAEYGLMLSQLEPYEPSYSLSSHRGVDRPFFIGNKPQKYYFRFPNGNMVAEEVQLSCRHELRVMLHPENMQKSPISYDKIVHGDAIFELGREFIPIGVRFEIPARHLLTPYESLDKHVPLAVFLLNYSGERIPLTRAAADEIRDKIEKAITKHWGLEIAKGGRLVSRPYPYHLLSKLIREYN